MFVSPSFVLRLSSFVLRFSSFVLFADYIAEVEGIHGVGAEALDVFVGEVEHLVVVEDDYRGFGHDEAVHLAVEGDALPVVGS